MNREEFIKILRSELKLYLEQNAIDNEIEYYDKYISDEVNKGRTEKEVIEELGDPRLIAKTIKTVNGNDEILAQDSTNSGSQNNNTYQKTSNSAQTIFNTYNSTSTFIGCLIFALILFIIILAILRFFGDIVFALGSVALSGPIGLLLIILLFYFIFGRNRKW